MMPSTEAAPATLENKPRSDNTPNQRLVSLDALRGFDMFWIVGAESLVHALNQLSQNKATAFLSNQLKHADWQGFHFYDLIFPMFVFMMGVSMVFSLSKIIAQAGRTDAVKRIIRRSILLYVIGVFYNGGFASSWPDIRLMGVLNRFAIAYLAGGILFCYFKPRALAALCVAILAGYWALMTFIPIRDITLTGKSLARQAEAADDADTAALFRDKEAGNPSAIKNNPAWAAAEKMFYATTGRVTGRYEMGRNLADHLDFQFLPGKKYEVYADPEGLLSSMTAVATCLLGALAGYLLMSRTIPDQRKVVVLIGCGIAAVALGWLWNLQFPVVKKIWTSSFVLVAGGYSALLLGVFYLVIDVWHARAWCQPFVWIGMNSITIYLTAHVLVSFRRLAERVVGGDVKTFFDLHLAKGMGDMVIAIVGLGLMFWFVQFLHKRKIFLRL
jgi:predicted acyltransferase